MNSLTLSPQETRDAINRLEAAIAAQPEARSDFEAHITHHFGDGTYAREMRMPKDMLVVGKIHRMAEICVLSKGIIMVHAEGEETAKVYQAPYTFVASPGKKAVYVLENAVFMNIHPNPTNTRDLAELEELLIAPDYQALEVQ